jgi:hypothetical protein
MNPQLESIIKYIFTNEELSSLLLIVILVIGVLLWYGIELIPKKKKSTLPK